MYYHTCLICRKLLTHEITWLSLFEKFPMTICLRCQQQFEPVEQTEQQVSYDDNQQLCTNSLYYYNEPMQDYLHRYKFMHDTVLAEVFRKELYTLLRYDNIVPIPMHPAKKKERTFPHIELLLKAAKLPYYDLLEKQSEDTQGTKTRTERLATKQPFALKQQPELKSYTIFDDIITTGTTLKHAEVLLKQAGVKQVKLVTLITAKQKDTIK